ncbi:MAG: methionyl-tRNA formyltransferase [Bryobacteraceae bacterium]
MGVRLVFLGTPEFAVPSLEKLAAAGHELAAVFTQPDRPKGRGGEISMPPVKIAAQKLGIAVHQPEKIRRPEVVEQLRALAPEAMIVVGYGQIVPPSILDIPPRGIINVHASLLPKYRGAAPIQWAIARGEKKTGVTTMRIDAGLDTGTMLLKWETEIGDEENAVELSARLSNAGAVLLIETLDDLDRIRPEPQDDSQATYAPILKKEDGHVDWGMAAREILNRIRGFLPWPGCYAYWQARMLRIWKAAGAGVALAPGELAVQQGKLFVGCGDGSVELLEVQPESKKKMTASAFLNGNLIANGDRLT